MTPAEEGDNLESVFSLKKKVIIKFWSLASDGVMT